MAEAKYRNTSHLTPRPKENLKRDQEEFPESVKSLEKMTVEGEGAVNKRRDKEIIFAPRAKPKLNFKIEI